LSADVDPTVSRVVAR